MRMQELTLQASDDTLYRVLDAVEDYLNQNGCKEEIMTEVLISVEEIYVNIAHYAYGGEAGEVVVQMGMAEESERFRIVFRDRGMPYNPLEKEDPDISLSAEEREIGGLGIYMVKQYMDSVRYRYEDGWNVLIMEREILQT